MVLHASQSSSDVVYWLCCAAAVSKQQMSKDRLAKNAFNSEKGSRRISRHRWTDNEKRLSGKDRLKPQKIGYANREKFRICGKNREKLLAGRAAAALPPSQQREGGGEFMLC